MTYVGRVVAGLASHLSAETDSLVVRVGLHDLLSVSRRLALEKTRRRART